MKKIHMLCNAHIDPVWHWEWQEGVGATLSTFRAAVEMCEETDDFVFCHNEAMLYQWVEEYEPELFERIKRLVKAGKWHIMGGWYLQPDCNIPCGESFIRQIRLGQAYFKEKFGVSPKVAVNFDSFGHSRGLVQIMKKAGYEGYIFMRPDERQMDLPAPDFCWVGFDGSVLPAHRLTVTYGLPRFGMAEARVRGWLAEHPEDDLGLITWGVGNHGGGPSRKDIAEINRLKAEQPESGLLHSTPEAYFADLNASPNELPRVEHSLVPFSVGCYTSQIRVKQMHRKLESALGATEKICTHAYLFAGLPYPEKELAEAEKDLCMAEFHDILPGTSIQRVEEKALQKLCHGLEITDQLHARAFFSLAAGEQAAKPGEIPILLYNPHPWPLEGDFTCEFNLPDSISDEVFIRPRVYEPDGEAVSQVEKEESSMPLEWRKRVVFHTTLRPGSVNRFDCRTETLDSRPQPACAQEKGRYVFDNGTMRVEIDRASGSITVYRINGIDQLVGETQALVMADDEDSWGMRVDSFRQVLGRFEAMTPAECAAFCAVKAEVLEPVRVVESGEVRTVIEACLKWKDSKLILRYILPAFGKHIEIEARAFWMEKHQMLKLAFPTGICGEYVGEAPFGTDRLFTDGRENVAQRWNAAVNRSTGRVFTVINDSTYGSDCKDGEIRVSLLRGAGLLAHPVFDRDILRQDRYTPHMDQGERFFRFRIEGGGLERLEKVGREAAEFNEAPYALSYFPAGGKSGPAKEFIKVSGDSVLLTAARPSESGIVLRLFNPLDRAAETQVDIPLIGVSGKVALAPGEIVTKLAKDGKLADVGLLC